MVIKESYGNGVAWWLTRKRYGDVNRLQNIVGSYTGIIADLIDTNINYSGNNLSFGMETIRNFKPGELNHVFLAVHSWADLESQIIAIANTELSPLKNELNTYINDYNGYGFDSYNQNLYNSLKNNLNNYLGNRNLLEDYGIEDDTDLLLPQSTLSNSNLRQQNVETLQQNLEVFNAYFNDLAELFNFWIGE